MLIEHRTPDIGSSCARRFAFSSMAVAGRSGLTRRSTSLRGHFSRSIVWPTVSMLAVALSVGCSRPSNFVPASELPAPSQETYRIQVADVLEVSFFRTPELSQTRTVGPDGEISLTFVGTLRVAGRTVEELGETINRLYASELRDPQITVSVAEYSGMNVYVAGEVDSPGLVPYRGGLTLVGAIMNAGGFLSTARPNQVVVIRRGPDGQPFGSQVNVRRVLAKARLDDDISLQPSDIVFVPRSVVANVNLFVEQYIRDNLPVPLFLGFDVGPVRTR